MKILSHRGFWLEPEEKNTITAFRRSFSCGFGTETDIRDYGGELVISHDIASASAILLKEFLDIYCEYGEELYLALNIKSDGLQGKLKEILASYQIKNYFVFDMSVPDALGYLRHEMNAFTRQSEYEKEPSFYDEAKGVWLDSFKSDWIKNDLILRHLKKNKLVCIVSPELHKRDYRKSWSEYKIISGERDLLLCTDFPQEAQEFFILK